MKCVLRTHEAWRKRHVKSDFRRMGRGANSAGYVLRRLRTQSSSRFLDYARNFPAESLAP